MRYTVALTQKAECELQAAADWWAEHRSAEQAGQWYLGICAAVESLAEHPQRCALSRENDRFPIELRELHYGLGSRPTHRLIFTIRSDVVLVLTLRHVAQAEITPDDV